MGLDSELVNKIKTLAEVSKREEAAWNEKYPNGQEITFGAGQTEDADNLVNEVLDGPQSPVYSELEKFSRNDLIQTMALMWFGRGDGVAGEGAAFDDVLKYATEQADESMASYIGGKAPLGRYLERGLTRLGNQ